MGPGARTAVIDDISYLTRSEHRVSALVAMTDRPRSRSELAEMTGVSSSTIRRTLREFEDRRWIRKLDYKYETTHLGSHVAAAMDDVLDRFELERSIRDVWDILPDEGSGFTIDMCADAVVTVADADDPYRPVSRLVELMDRTDRFRFVGFEVAMLEPCKDALCERILAGMNAEIINPPRVANYIRSSCTDLFEETLESGNLTVRLHDDLPGYGVSIFDDRIAVSGYDADHLTVRALVDTDAPAAREWAESMYRRYRRETPIVPIGPPEE